jgi:RNA recognition motif-containing protein
MNCACFGSECYTEILYAAAVHLVMDRVAKRPRGFAFLSYADEAETKAAMEGMHGKVRTT